MDSVLCFTEFKAANHVIWWRAVGLGCPFYRSISVFWKTDLYWNLSPGTADGRMDRLARTASGQPLLVSLSNWLWDFDLCCPTAAEVLPQRKAKVGTESSSFHILEERASITCFICNLLALEKHGHSFLLSFTAGEKDHLYVIVKTKSLMYNKKAPKPNLAKPGRVFFLSMKQW